MTIVSYSYLNINLTSSVAITLIYGSRLGRIYVGYNVSYAQEMTSMIP